LAIAGFTKQEVTITLKDGLLEIKGQKNPEEEVQYLHKGIGTRSFIKTIKLADKIASLAPMAQSMTKKAMKISYLADLHSSLDTLAAFQAITQRSADHFEAILAFKEKRSSQFKFE
jgi:hypothetical protein